MKYLCSPYSTDWTVQNGLAWLQRAQNSTIYAQNMTKFVHLLHRLLQIHVMFVVGLCRSECSISADHLSDTLNYTSSFSMTLYVV